MWLTRTILRCRLTQLSFDRQAPVNDGGQTRTIQRCHLTWPNSGRQAPTVKQANAHHTALPLGPAEFWPPGTKGDL